MLVLGFFFTLFIFNVFLGPDCTSTLAQIASEHLESQLLPDSSDSEYLDLPKVSALTSRLHCLSVLSRWTQLMLMLWLNHGTHG